MSTIRKVGVLTLLDQVTTTATGNSVEPYHTNRTYEAFGSTSAGTGSASIVIEARNSESAAWKTLVTISLSLTTAGVSDGAQSSAAWRYIRARVTTLTGTGATVSATLGTSPL